MKRFHIHLAVENLDQNIAFYSAMFACQPSVQYEDYAKWMLDDLRVNFAISNRSAKTGVDHLGIQAENDSELREIKNQIESTQRPVEAQEQVACCYSRSEKYWTTDPQGIAWESFHSLSEMPTFNDESPADEKAVSCCPASSTSSCCN